MKNKLRQLVDVVSNDISSNVKITIFYLTLLVWATWLFVTSLEWGRTDRLFPILIGIPLILMLMLEVVQINTNLAEWGRDTKEESDELVDQYQASQASKRTKSDQLKYEMLMIFWVILLPILIYLIGFMVSIPLFIFSFCLFFIKDLKIAVTVTTVFSLSLFILFIVILEVSLWEGVITELLF